MSLLEECVNWPDFAEATGEEYSFKKITFNVALITAKHVGKFPRFWHFDIPNDQRESALRKLKQEHDIVSEAYRAGICVPKPEGMFTVTIDKSAVLKRIYAQTGEKLPTFVMQYIDGQKLSHIKEISAEVNDLWENEIEKATKSGFTTFDAQDWNAIFNPEQNKVYLIDLEYWGRR